MKQRSLLGVSLIALLSVTGIWTYHQQTTEKVDLSDVNLYSINRASKEPRNFQSHNLGLSASSPTDLHNQLTLSEQTTHTRSQDSQPFRKKGRTQTEAKPLWKYTEGVEEDEYGIPIYRLKSDFQSLAQLELDQRFSIHLPEINQAVEALLDGHYQMSEQVDMWEGKITNLDEGDNIIIARGEIETHVIISTRKGVFSARIDNQTGETTLVNETHANPNLGTDGDFINAPRPDLPQ